MQLDLFPKPRNLALGVAIGLGAMIIGRFVTELGRDPDNAAAVFWVGLAIIAFGVWVAGSCAMSLWRPKPSFRADAEGFSIMGGRKQPWSRYHGVGVMQLKQYGLTTMQSVYVRVGGSARFARKKNIRWTHLSDSAAQMASRIAAFSEVQQMTQAGSAQPGPVKRHAAAQPRRPSRPAPGPTTDDFEDGPIRSGGRGLRGLFGG